MVSKKKFKAYLEVQKGGQTNMYAVNIVCMLSNYILSKKDCSDIMKNYSQYTKKFNLTTKDVNLSKTRLETRVVQN